MLILWLKVPDDDPNVGGSRFFGRKSSVSGIALAMNFGCRGDGILGCRIIARTPGRVPEWFWWSADFFLGHRLSVENIAQTCGRTSHRYMHNHMTRKALFLRSIVLIQ